MINDWIVHAILHQVTYKILGLKKAYLYLQSVCILLLVEATYFLHHIVQHYLLSLKNYRIKTEIIRDHRDTSTFHKILSTNVK